MTQKIPFIHSTRNDAQNVRFQDEFVLIDLADGRVIGMPINWFPWLHRATGAQRERYDLHGDSVYWEELDEGIDLVAMLTGLYIKDKPRPKETIEQSSAVTT
ncbi:MAG: DUF2442 domain-containing protein [Chloroflexi bacterium]|nr:DUF2442 domain-containing protein [Chloroflexota bacterium]